MTHAHPAPDLPALPANPPPAAAPSPPAEPSRHRFHWLFEGLLIVVSVLLGFGVSEMRESRAERELIRRALDGIRAEVEHNAGVLDPYVPMHAQWMTKLDAVDPSEGGGTALDVWFATRPPLDGRTPFPFLRRSAWDAAVAGGALRLIDYDVLAALADIYGMQDLVADNVQRLASGALSTPDLYDAARRPPSVRLLRLTLADIQSAETLLLERYRRHLPAIAAAANAAR